MIELSLLGAPELRKSGEVSDSLIVQPRRLALLAYLAAAPGTFHRRDRLLLLFWGEQPEARARASLRQALYFIRRTLGEDVLVVRGDEEVGLNAATTRVDVHELERAIAEDRLEAALDLYRGDFLAHFNIGNAPEFERWASERRRELRRVVVDAAWQLSGRSTTPKDAVRWAHRAVGIADFSEHDVRRAMEVAAAAGDRSTALELHEALTQRLAEDTDGGPDAATTALAERVRTGELGAQAASAISPFAASSQQGAETDIIGVGDGRGSSFWRIAGAVAVLLVSLAGGAFILRASRAGVEPAVTETNRIAVLPFAVRTRSGDIRYMREGAATLLALALDGAGRLRIVDPNAVLAAAPAEMDIASGRKLATTMGAGQFVLGEIEEAGTNINIAATVYDAAGKPRARATATGDERHVFDLVDSLARRLAVSAMTDSTVRIANAAATATRSLSAFKLFLAGETSLRSGRYRDAVASLQAAVAADSTFGLAYYRLSLAREWTDGEISSDSAAMLAERFSARLPERDRKLLAARRAFVRRDLPEAERLTRSVLAAYPTDADAWAQLGEVLFHLGPNSGRDIDEARGPYLTVLRYRPNDLSARIHLTRIAAHAGNAAALDEWSGKGAGLGEASEVGTFELATMRAVVLGDARARDAVESEMMRATDLTASSAVWRLTIYTDDPDYARTLAERRRAAGLGAQDAVMRAAVAGGHLTAPHWASDSLLERHAALVGLMLALPSAPDLPNEARRVHDEMAALASRRAIVAARTAGAARLLEIRYPALTPLALKAAQPEPRMVQAVASALQLLASDPQRALGLMAPVQLDEPSLITYGLYDIVASIRAEALHTLHRDAECVQWLSSIGMNSMGSSASIAPATRRMAEIEEAMGDHESALRLTGRFSRMWQSADPDLRAFVPPH